MSRPEAVTDFQAGVAQVFFSLPESDSFLLAGGLALLAQGMSSRPTEDMDAFTSKVADVARASAAFQVAARAQGWEIEVLQESDTFVRLGVAGEHELIVDIALDSPPGLSPTMSVLGPTFAPDELTARKLLALYGRALPRDFVDVFRVMRSRDRDVIMALARDLDAGFDSGALVTAMNQVSRYSDDQLGIDATEAVQLRDCFRAWSGELDAGR